MYNTLPIPTNPNTVGYQVYHIQQEYGDGHPWRVIYSYQSGDDTINAILIDDVDVYEYFMNTYRDYICRDMWAKFDAYNQIHARDLEIAQLAYYAEYNPLDNYNGETEHIHTRDDGDETRTHKTGGDGGTHNKVTSQALANTYTQHDVTTYDNATPRMDSKDTQNGGTETTDDLHTEDKTVHGTTSKTIGDTTYTGDEVYHEIEKKHGNLGVTTSQQMIDSELTMRFNPVNKRYLDQFINEYAYYIGGAWECDNYDCTSL